MIIFFFGQDDFRSRQKLKEIKNKFNTEVDPGGSSLNVFNGEKVTIKEVVNALNAQSLLARKRMVVIENLFLNKTKGLCAEFLEYLQKINAEKIDNIIVIWEASLKVSTAKSKSPTEKAVIIDSSGNEKALDNNQKKLFEYLKKQKFTQEFKSLSNIDLVNWIKQKANDSKTKIAPDAIQSLISLCENNLWQIDNELNKILNYKAGLNPEIIAKDVEGLVKGKFDENIFNLTDAISSKNRALASKLLSRQYESGMSDGYILSMFLRQFKILLQIRQELDFGANSRKIITDLKLHPFIVQKGINQARNFNLQTLKNIIAKLISIDAGIKTGKANCRVELDLLISKI